MRLRLQELLKLVLLQHQIISLVSAEEAKRLSVVLAPSSNISCFSDDISGIELFYKTIEPLEYQLALVLKKKIHGLSPETLLFELSRYTELLNLPRVSAEFVSERDLLLGSMHSLLSELRNSEAVENESSLNTYASPVVKTLAHLSALKSRVRTCSSVVGQVLNMVQGESKFQDEARILESRITENSKSIFSKFSNDCLDSLDDKNSSLALRTRGALIEFDLVSGFLKVNYSESLVLLQREVRQLSELGFKVFMLIFLNDYSRYPPKF